MPRNAGPFLLVPLTLLLAGCGEEPATVKGTVTYEGKKVDGARITFFPVNKKDEMRTADIVDGSYALTDLTPGKRRVLIVANARMTTEKVAGKAIPKANPPAQPIPENADGNNRVIDVAAGPHV